MVEEMAATQRIAGVQQNMSAMAIKQNAKQQTQISNMLETQTKQQEQFINSKPENSTFSIKA